RRRYKCGDPTRKPLRARQRSYECKFKSPRPCDPREIADRVPSMFGGRSGATPLRLQRRARQNLTATQEEEPAKRRRYNAFFRDGEALLLPQRAQQATAKRSKAKPNCNAGNRAGATPALQVRALFRDGERVEGAQQAAPLQ